MNASTAIRSAPASPASSPVASRVDDRAISARFVTCLLAIAVAAIVALLWATAPFGSGVTADSVSYLNAAQSLTQGSGLLDTNREGLPVMLTHYPPLFSMVLAATAMLAHVPLESAARWLNCLLFGASLLLVGLHARRL